jgi:hypothetical protein
MRSGPALTSAGSLGSSAFLAAMPGGGGFDLGVGFGDQFVEIGDRSRSGTEFGLRFGDGGGELVGLGFVRGDFLLRGLGGGELAFEILHLGRERGVTGFRGELLLRAFERGIGIGDGFVSGRELGGLRCDRGEFFFLRGDLGGFLAEGLDRGVAGGLVLIRLGAGSLEGGEGFFFVGDLTGAGLAAAVVFGDFGADFGERFIAGFGIGLGFLMASCSEGSFPVSSAMRCSAWTMRWAIWEGLLT